jgi:hypothetical protein
VSISFIALVIALSSLVWNIVSSLHSWRTSTPAVKLRLVGFWPNIDLNVLNKGGSQVSIAQAGVVVRYRLYWRNSRGSSRGIWAVYIPDGIGGMAGALGTSLPFTLSGYHSHKFKFSGTQLNGFWDMALKAPAESAKLTKVFIMVELGNGKIIRKKLHKSHFKSAKPPALTAQTQNAT